MSSSYAYHPSVSSTYPYMNGALGIASQQAPDASFKPQLIPIHSKQINLNKIPRCPLPSSIFTGRLETLEHMRSQLLSTEERQVVVLHGHAGAGKSQLAYKFIHSRYYGRGYHSQNPILLYVDASSTHAVDSCFSDIAESTGIGSTKDDVLEWLASINDRWLIFFDNADDDKLNLCSYFPSGSKGTILITTRHTRIVREYAVLQPSASYHLGKLEEDEASMLLQRATQVQDMTHATTLIKKLQYSPLAIVHAGAAIQRLEFSIQEYLHEMTTRSSYYIKEDRIRHHELHGYNQAVYTTWRASYETLDSSTQSLFAIFSFMHHDHIGEDIFRRAFEHINDLALSPLSNTALTALNEAKRVINVFGDPPPHRRWDTLKFRKSVAELNSYSFIRYEHNYYSLDRLAQQWTRRLQSFETLLLTLFLLAASLYDASNSSWRAILPHLDALKLQASDRLDHIPSPVSLLIGSVYHRAGRCDEAAFFYRRALSLFRDVRTESCQPKRFGALPWMQDSGERLKGVYIRIHTRVWEVLSGAMRHVTTRHGDSIGANSKPGESPASECTVPGGGMASPMHFMPKLSDTGRVGRTYSRWCNDNSQVANVLPIITTFLTRLLLSLPTRLSDAIQNVSLTGTEHRSVLRKIEDLLTRSFRDETWDALASRNMIVSNTLQTCRGGKAVDDFISALAQSAELDVPLKRVMESELDPASMRLLSQIRLGRAFSQFILHNTPLDIEDTKLYITDTLLDATRMEGINIVHEEDWPSMVDILACRSNSLLYAAVACRYVQDAHDIKERLRELTSTYFEPILDSDEDSIDSLYRYILQKAFNQKNKEELSCRKAVLVSLAYFQDPPSMNFLSALLHDADVHQALSDLLSLVIIPSSSDGALSAFHSSFPTFLRNQLRSRDFYLDPAESHLSLAQGCMRMLHDTLYGKLYHPPSVRPTRRITDEVIDLLELDPAIILAAILETYDTGTVVARSHLAMAMGNLEFVEDAEAMWKEALFQFQGIIKNRQSNRDAARSASLSIVEWLDGVEVFLRGIWDTGGETVDSNATFTARRSPPSSLCDLKPCQAAKELAQRSLSGDGRESQSIPGRRCPITHLSLQSDVGGDGCSLADARRVSTEAGRSGLGICSLPKTGADSGSSTGPQSAGDKPTSSELDIVKELETMKVLSQGLLRLLSNISNKREVVDGDASPQYVAQDLCLGREAMAAGVQRVRPSCTGKERHGGEIDVPDGDSSEEISEKGSSALTLSPLKRSKEVEIAQKLILSKSLTQEAKATLALILIGLGRMKDAEAILKEILEQAPPSSDGNGNPSGSAPASSSRIGGIPVIGTGLFGQGKQLLQNARQQLLGWTHTHEPSHSDPLILDDDHDHAQRDSIYESESEKTGF